MKATVMVLMLAGLVGLPALAAQSLYPAKDGTLADGGVYGPFDGTADDADWYFNQSSYEGSISRSTTGAGLEHRVTWEYDLAGVTVLPPVQATLRFVLRGAPVFPMPDAKIHVYSYPADLQESLGDFNAGPAVLQGIVTVPAYQAPTVYTVDVSAVVNAAIVGGGRKVAFRFQIDPATSNPANQAYIDAIDSDATTKPRLTVEEAPAAPGDIDADGDVDAEDFLGFPPCMSGPDVPPATGCNVYDFDSDADVDLADYRAFQGYLTTAR
ncbi:MAG TPA: hypothetical protein P5572_10780 [Phycisphaerae bacterium]|nr:hypothetical protein [Phycisphaerae bacterium]